MVLQKTSEEKQKEYKQKLGDKVSFAKDIEGLEENETFKKLINWLKKELERTKDQMLICPREELIVAREFACGVKMLLRQIEVWKKNGHRALEILKKLDNK